MQTELSLNKNKKTIYLTLRAYVECLVKEGSYLKKRVKGRSPAAAVLYVENTRKARRLARRWETQ